MKQSYFQSRYFYNGWVANYKVIKGASKAAKFEFLKVAKWAFPTGNLQFWGLEYL